MALQSYHITYNNDEWQFKKEGSSRSLKKASTKREIVAEMRSYMAGKKGSVRIHKKDGTVQEERTYPRSADPRSSKG